MADYITHEDWMARDAMRDEPEAEPTIDSMTDGAMAAYSLRWGITDPQLRADARKVIRAAIAKAWDRH